MGRGRLNHIELLPEECSHVVSWAAGELQDREKTQTDIYQEFVTKLQAVDVEYRGELDIRIPSFSAFNRYSIKLATMTRRLDETREIAAAIAGKFDAKASDDLTLIAAEAIKTLIFELLTSHGESGIDPKGAMSLANALFRASQAQGISSARRQKVEAEFKGKVKEVIDTVAREKGMSAEVVAQLRHDFLGVRKKGPA